MKIRILIVDDEEIFLVQLKMALKGMGLEISTARNGMEALQKLEKRDFNIVVTDLKMPGMDGLQLLENIRKSYPHIYVVIVTAYGEIPQVVQAMRLGAYDFIQKPFDINLLELSLKKILQTHALIEENVSLRREVEERYDFHQIVGKNHRMKRVYELITLAAESDTTTLIRGETGTGKELVAKAIHYHSPRKKKPLITVNCAAIPEALLESELFGHERGAFTGAHNRKIGSFELAHQGTLFLDEIGDCPLSPHCQHLTIDLKEINQYTTFGTFLLSSVVRELKKTVQSIRILGISSGQEGNFKNLGMVNMPEYAPPCGFEGTSPLMKG